MLMIVLVKIGIVENRSFKKVESEELTMEARKKVIKLK